MSVPVFRALQIWAEVFNRKPVVTLWKSEARAAVARMAGLEKGEVLVCG